MSVAVLLNLGAVLILPVLAISGVGRRAYYATLLVLAIVLFVPLNGTLSVRLPSDSPEEFASRRDLTMSIMNFVACTAIGSLFAVILFRAKKQEIPSVSSTTINQKRCPACAEFVQLEAKICKFCRHEFSSTS